MYRPSWVKFVHVVGSAVVALTLGCGSRRALHDSAIVDAVVAWSGRNGDSGAGAGGIETSTTSGEGGMGGVPGTGGAGGEVGMGGAKGSGGVLTGAGGQSGTDGAREDLDAPTSPGGQDGGVAASGGGSVGSTGGIAGSGAGGSAGGPGGAGTGGNIGSSGADGALGSCPTGRFLCDGRCANVINDPANCGACGVRCSGATPYCTDRTCVATPCAAGAACNPGETCCGSVCCGAGQVCCAIQIPPGSYPGCYAPTADEPTCPAGCSPQCQ